MVRRGYTAVSFPLPRAFVVWDTLVAGSSETALKATLEGSLNVGTTAVLEQPLEQPVGPRPEQLDLVDRYAPEHQFRLQIKPGITGPMQVYGRGELTFEERLAVEREYVENLSLARDLRILVMTLPAVFGRRGAF